MALTKSHILAVVLCLTMLCVPLAVMSNDDASAANESKPTITDAGYIENQASFLYYAKWVLGGTAGTKPSVDTPSAGSGKTMYSNSVFLRVDDLDKNATYTVKVSEFSSEDSSDATASFEAKITGMSYAVVYYSVEHGGTTVYNKGVAIDAANVTFTGTFTTTTGSQIYKMSLKNSNGDELSSTTVKDIAHFSHIVRADVVDYNESYGDTDLITALGQNYGFGGTSAQYTADKISSDGMDKYVFVLFITNVSSATYKINSGSNSYTVDAEHTFLNTDGSNQPLTAGMGIVAVSESILDAKGLDINSASFSIGDGSNTYANSDIDSHNGEKKSNTLLYIGIGAIAAVIIIAILVAFKLKG